MNLTIIGHRGAAGLVAENTIPSFIAALDLGCQTLELDVHRVNGSAGFRLAVIHDDELIRTTGIAGRVNDYSADTLSQIDAGGAGIPMLDEVCDAIRAWARAHRVDPASLCINIELKGRNTAATVHEFIQNERSIKFIVSSFDHQELSRFRDLDKFTRIGVLYHRWHNDWQALAERLQAYSVNLSVRIATAKRVHAIQQAGYEVWVYTVNDRKKAERLAEMGVSAIFSDRPDLLLEQASGRRPSH